MNQSSILIAGGSSGLGAACVRRFAAAGRHGVIADLRPPNASLLEECGQSFAFCQADVTDETTVRAALTTARERFGPVRGVVVIRRCARFGAFSAGRASATWVPFAALLK